MKNPIVTDLEGNPIEVTDLPKAIAQCEEYLTWKHADPAYAKLDQTIHAHWQHLLNQLRALSGAQPNPLSA